MRLEIKETKQGYEVAYYKNGLMTIWLRQDTREEAVKEAEKIIDKTIMSDRKERVIDILKEAGVEIDKKKVKENLEKEKENLIDILTNGLDIGGIAEHMVEVNEVEKTEYYDWVFKPKGIEGVYYPIIDYLERS